MTISTQWCCMALIFWSMQSLVGNYWLIVLRCRDESAPVGQLVHNFGPSDNLSTSSGYCLLSMCSLDLLVVSFGLKSLAVFIFNILHIMYYVISLIWTVHFKWMVQILSCSFFPFPFQLLASYFVVTAGRDGASFQFRERLIDKKYFKIFFLP